MPMALWDDAALLVVTSSPRPGDAGTVADTLATARSGQPGRFDGEWALSGGRATAGDGGCATTSGQSGGAAAAAVGVAPALRDPDPRWGAHGTMSCDHTPLSLRPGDAPALWTDAMHGGAGVWQGGWGVVWILWKVQW